MLEALSQGKISEGHCRPLMSLGDRPEEQMTLFKEIMFKKLTVREAEAIGRRIAYEKIRNKSYILDPETLELEEKLTESLGTRVSIEKKEKGGKITIDFFSPDDLKNILKLIESNTTIPTKKSEVFSTAADSQTSVEIHILQGERPMATQNKSIGRFHLDGIPPAPRGIPQVEVIFDIDANGILNVTAKDKATGKSQQIRIEASSGLSDAEIQRMKEEATANAEVDRKMKEEIDKLNTADSLIFQTEKQLKEYGDKVPADKRDAIQKVLEELKTAHKNKDIPGMDKAMESLNAMWQKASEEMYKNAGPSQQEGAPGGQPHAEQEAGKAPGGKDDVTDVDFEEVKDK